MARTLETLSKQYRGDATAPGSMGPGRGPGGPGPGGRQMGPGAVRRPVNTRAVIGRIFVYVARYKIRLIVVLLCMLLSTAASLAGSYILRPITNLVADGSLSVEARISKLIAMLVVLAGVYLVAVAATYLQNRMMVGISQISVERIRNDLFHKMEELPIRFYDNESNGELMSRFTNDIDNIGLMLDQSMISLVSGTITLIGTLIMMLFTNIWLALITVAFIPIFTRGSAYIHHGKKPQVLFLTAGSPGRGQRLYRGVCHRPKSGQGLLP